MMRKHLLFLTVALFVAFGASPSLAFTLKKQFDKGVFEYQGLQINPKPLQGIYEANKYKGIWTSKKGLFGLKRGLTKNGKQLVETLSNAADEGLNTKRYSVPETISKKQFKGKEIDRLELFLTASFLKFARDLHLGVVDASHLQADIFKAEKSFDPNAVMKLLKKKGLEKTLASLRPQHPQYDALRKTLANTSDPSKRALIAANLERWRWLPTELGEKHILVNQPAYEVFVYNKTRIVDQRRVIIGKREHASPQFSDTMTYVEFNPQWNVPQSIAVNEYVPKLLKNPGYLRTRGYTLFENWNHGAKELDGRKVKWSKIDRENPKKFPYRIVQGEGPRNALGQVKFLFPNEHAIYLHDTPSKKLFKSKNRAYSHGCIRIHKPLDFARKIFELSGGIAPSKIDALVKKGDRKQVNLKNPIPIHLAYFTTWVDQSGKLHVLKDVYARDPVILAALR